MIYNKKFQTKPYFAHAMGKLCFCPLYAKLLSINRTHRYNGPHDDISIVTFNNGASHNDKNPKLLINSLNRFGIKSRVLGANIHHWQNRFKIQLLANELESITTKHIIVSDCSDVLMLRPLKGMIAEFESFNADAVFNAEVNIWPIYLDQAIIDFEESIAKTELKFLNAGLWIARTEFAKIMVKHLLAIQSDVKSEQFYYKNIYKQLHPRMVIDCSCKLFQPLNRIPEEDCQLQNFF